MFQSLKESLVQLFRSVLTVLGLLCAVLAGIAPAHAALGDPLTPLVTATAPDLPSVAAMPADKPAAMLHACRSCGHSPPFALAAFPRARNALPLKHGNGDDDEGQVTETADINSDTGDPPPVPAT
jgi:hypothetical protein